MNKIDFNKEERDIIAEYIFSYNTDVLIKPDAIRLIDLFNKYDLISDAEVWKENVKNQSPNISTALYIVLCDHIQKEQMDEIMNEYYGR